MSLKLLLNLMMYGEADYNIKIADIESKRYVFEMNGEEEQADLDAIDRYGLAIRSAKAFHCQEHFVLTKKGNLLCGHLPDLPVVLAKIVVDKNLEFLNEYSRTLREGRAVASVKIPDFFDPKKDRTIEPGPYSLIFLGDPIEVS